MFVKRSAPQTAAYVLSAIISIITKLFMPDPVLSLPCPKGPFLFPVQIHTMRLGRAIGPPRLWLALAQAQILILPTKPSRCASTPRLDPPTLW